MAADPTSSTPEPAGELAALAQAFEIFTRTARRLEHEYAALRLRVGELTVALERKNHGLATPLFAEGAFTGLTVREMERRLIVETLERTRNNRTQAAKLLGISIRTLRNKLADYRRRAGSTPSCEPGI